MYGRWYYEVVVSWRILLRPRKRQGERYVFRGVACRSPHTSLICVTFVCSISLGTLKLIKLMDPKDSAGCNARRGGEVQSLPDVPRRQVAPPPFSPPRVLD